MVAIEFPDWDSYYWPGTKVLQNLFHEHDQDKLNDLELVSHLMMWFERLNEPTNYAEMKPSQFAAAVAEPWGEINAAHSFREGNTRAQIMFFAQFAATHGHFLDYERFARDEWFRAKFNAGRFLVQHNTDTSLLAEALSQVVDRRMTGKSRTRQGILPAYEPHYVTEPMEVEPFDTEVKKRTLSSGNHGRRHNLSSWVSCIESACRVGAARAAVVKRFSSKEERSRVVASAWSPVEHPEVPETHPDITTCTSCSRNEQKKLTDKQRHKNRPHCLTLFDRVASQITVPATLNYSNNLRVRVRSRLVVMEL